MHDTLQLNVACLLRVMSSNAMLRDMSDDHLLTSPQVAHRLGKSIRTVHRLAESGDLVPVQKLPGPNGAYLFRESDVERLVKTAA